MKIGTEQEMFPRMDMFFHIASIERDIYWQLGNVTCSAYPLKCLYNIKKMTIVQHGELAIP